MPWSFFVNWHLWFFYRSTQPTFIFGFYYQTHVCYTQLTWLEVFWSSQHCEARGPRATNGVNLVLVSIRLTQSTIKNMNTGNIWDIAEQKLMAERTSLLSLPIIVDLSSAIRATRNYYAKHFGIRCNDILWRLMLLFCCLITSIASGPCLKMITTFPSDGG